MDQNRVLMSHIMLELPDCLQKRLALNITCRSSHLNDSDSLFIRCLSSVEASLYLIGDMRNHLHCPAAVISVAFLMQNRPVYLTRCHIGVLIQTFIYKPFIMSQVQIRFCPIICYENLPMLDRIHSTGVHIDVGVKFLHGHLISSGI